MYGPTPSITMDSCSSPPPEKMFKSPKNWLFAKKDARAFLSTPGIGTAASKRKSASAPAKKKIRNRISGSLNASLSFRIKVLIMNCTSGCENCGSRRSGYGTSFQYKSLRKSSGTKNLNDRRPTLRSAHQISCNERRRRDSLSVFI